MTSLVEQAGRVVAPLPLASHVAAAMTVARFGSDAQRRAWLPGAVSGELVLAPAIAEDHAASPDRPATAVRTEADAVVLTGTKTLVRAGTAADLFLVPATGDDGPAVLLVRPDDPGVSVVAQQVTDGDVTARLELDGVRLDGDRRLGGAEVHAWLRAVHDVALCAEQLGTCEGALALTSAYARTREQFGRPIGSFQAVSQRLADAFIDVRGLRLVVTEAAWRLSEDLPCEVEVATARLWAADTGHTVAHTTVHVHGGVGIDLDGAAHRYFTAAKRAEITLGGTTLQARQVGLALAAEPV
jgi:alkylation response protein AidB-like acyl-CoA dehydrogenase